MCFEDCNTICYRTGSSGQPGHMGLIYGKFVLWHLLFFTHFLSNYIKLYSSAWCHSTLQLASLSCAYLSLRILYCRRDISVNRTNCDKDNMQIKYIKQIKHVYCNEIKYVIIGLQVSISHCWLFSVLLNRNATASYCQSSNFWIKF